ncbi:hypothetical protein AB7M56_008528 [Bradyrhizobium elkanii]|nr:hypothetical protein [Bradyrhizobium elkanii]MCS3521703.1 hypothetical protein [Bradyrhizobium elkanii]MCS4069358.1 hypothetical protein [Bradyrhizobium elkanii]MCS4084892.1 hypothetical protein [Bradyrhizobium elkanii]MCW2125439.1 hypothetical protein [Bradyrhizobium elkanii]MCW2172186.1 hypothetical protein [Bradyrhizobium elkanii]
MVATTYRVSVDAIPRQNRREVWREALAGLQLDCELPEAGQFQFGELTAKRSTSGGQLALLRSTEQQIVCSGHAASPGMPARVAIIFHGYGRGSITSGQRSCEFADNDVSVCDLQSP